MQVIRLLSIIICAAALTIFSVILLVKASTYKATLKEAKKIHRYQLLTVDVFRKILPCVGYDRFVWSDWIPSEFHWDSNCYRLLWYRMENQSWILVDIGFLTAQLFVYLLQLQCKKEEKTKILSNESNLILADVQNVLQRKIDQNNQDMLRAAKEQQRIIQRLSPFEIDYVKSKVEVDA